MELGEETPLSGFWLGFLSSTVFDVLLVVPFEDKRTVEIRKNLLRAEAAIEREPEKARTIWDFSRLQLELYITLNLAQVRKMFWITVTVMVAGFGLVVFGVWRAFDDQLKVAYLTAGFDVITQMIGATFLILYRSTMNQARDHLAALDRINAVGMAVQIVDLISDENSRVTSSFSFFEVLPFWRWSATQWLTRAGGVRPVGTPQFRRLYP